MGAAFVFPGQGSQAPGMGQEVFEAFPVARHVLEEVDDALEQKLSRLIAEGPAEELTLTENAQPALMAVSIAILRVLETEAGIDLAKSCTFVAGHSLGEYSALVAARTLGLVDGARLLKTRGQAMQVAVPVGAGAMAALIGADLDIAREIAEAAADGEVCQTGNDNAPGQVVLSGAKDAIDRAIEIAAERGIKRAVPLPVSAPFHCDMMQPAADVMEEALAETKLVRPVVSLVANVTAEAVDDPDTIRKLLVEQVTAMVRWRESVEYMRDNGAETIVEIGAGKVLSGLVRRIDRDLKAVSVSTPDDIDGLVKAL
jgi:[acyl-carrier-protein] S-malonyltransferase